MRKLPHVIVAAALQFQRRTVIEGGFRPLIRLIFITAWSD
jgi:hypothetical protein